MSDTSESYESYIDHTGILQVWWRMVLQQGYLKHNTFGNSKFLPLPLDSPPSRSRSESTDFLSDSTSSESEGWAASRPLTPPDNKIIQRQLNLWALSWEVSLHPPIPFHPYLSPPLLGPPHCCVINSQAPAGGGGGGATFPLPRSVAGTKPSLITNRSFEQGTGVSASAAVRVMCRQLLQRLVLFLFESHSTLHRDRFQ